MSLFGASREELEKWLGELRREYEEYRKKNMSLDMSRGKPGSDQLDLCEDLLTVLSKNEDMIADGVDSRNYGMMDGLPACRRLFGELLGVPEKNVIAGGNSSLSLMFDLMLTLWVRGDASVKEPWMGQGVKFIAVVPGYDRHFTICEKLGIEMVTVPMLETGPDMDRVEELARDPKVKGIWCVPKYSNPTGTVYCDETVRRLASMKTAASDFKIFWDNAYIVHNLGQDVPLLSLWEECLKNGTEDRAFMLTSTSKISFPGAGVAAVALSDRNMAWFGELRGARVIGPDKVNQLRHVRYFGDARGIEAHMRKHAAILKPKFDLVADILRRRLGGKGIAEWSEPKGGYFVSFDALPGCAKRIHALCREAGVTMTGPGATYPYGKDPQDSNLRIAPSYPPLGELEVAMEVFCTCAEMAAVEKLLEMK